MPSKRKILVTSALPAANGPIHIGHLVETVLTDIWVRAQKLRGHECIYVCADDAHGTPVMLRAEREGITPEELIDRLETEHRRDFSAFSIDFDQYHSTHSPENRFFAEQFYSRLEEKGHVTTRRVTQFYDPQREIFLADRYIKGTCPSCASENQNGDNCDVCGAVYQPRDLIDPISAITGARPIERDSEHYFIKLGDFESVLREWVTPDRLQSEVVNKLEEWFEEGLRDWDISRDEPYFGFEIPGAPGKYFYVWLDAPIGYMASFRVYCDRHGLDFDAYWGRDSDAELYHFIGKDIVYFHCLFWPAMLHGAGYRMPTSVLVHGFLTAGGQKMSKSRGTQLEASTYLRHLDADYLRYYYAAKLGSGLGDIDITPEDFVNRVNSDLIGKVVNIASRCFGLLHRHCDGRLGPTLDSPDILARAVDAGEEIAAGFEAREYNRTIRRVMALADEANRYIATKEPWSLAREEDKGHELQAVLTTAINLFRVIVVYLKPVIPATAARAESLLRVAPLQWSDSAEPLLEHQIEPYEALLTRVEKATFEAMMADSLETAQRPSQSSSGD